ncbi:MAG TPA: 4Fe-4S dicluster domain-containing protein [Vicinamibacterales bacterium]
MQESRRVVLDLLLARCPDTPLVLDGRFGQPRINVMRHGEQRGTPIVCLQCNEAACVAACPSGALRRNGRTDAIDLDPQRCIRCRACVGACPFGNVLWDEGAHLAEKCDLCGGQPWCVKFCPTGAVTFRSFDSRTASSPTACETYSPTAR